MKLSAAVVGLGKIGQEYDYTWPDASKVLTHATAFHHHPGFELVAGVDPDAERRRHFTAKFACSAFESIEAMYATVSPQVLALAVPTPMHASALSSVVRRAPLAVLCEKPLAASLEDACEMVRAAKAANVLLAVNYMRRCEPGVLELKRRIAAGDLGTFYKGVQWYTKGILTNGSHFIDLLAYLFGPATAVRTIVPGRTLGFDSEPDVKVSFGSVDVYFLAAREECFSLRELQLISDTCEVRYGLGGDSIEVRRTRPHPLVPGYTVLGDSVERIATDLPRYQWHVVAALYDAIAAGKPLALSASDALETMRVLHEITSSRIEVSHV